MRAGGGRGRAGEEPLGAHPAAGVRGEPGAPVQPGPLARGRGAARGAPWARRAGGALFTIREGVHSGNVRARLFLARPDGPRCRPLIFGRGEIAAGRLAWGGRWIQLDPSRFDAAAGDYLNLGDPALYERPKLLVRRTGDHVLAAPDLEGRWCSNNFFLLVPKAPMSEAELLRACDALNAPEATEYFRLLQPRTGRRFAELKITHLKEIPLAGFPPPPQEVPAAAPAAAGP
ncbi:MAG: TaqI-like C-terminal specificity domain-containing protein [Anaeromyxobacteraceae bacterium]